MITVVSSWRARPVVAAFLSAGLVLSGVARACTTLTISDTKGGVYFGRTMEMALDFPYQVTAFPAGRFLSSTLANGASGLRYRTRHRILAVTVPPGKQVIVDNPVNVMTNGPSFAWHLTNLANYSFLTNVDKSQGTFGSLTVVAPDSGVATSGLPSANTSVGRFVRAAFYSQYAKRSDIPDDAVRVLAHVMNNFDRPVNITIDPASSPVANEKVDHAG